MNGFWTWYAQLPAFTTRHPLPGLIISLAILYIMFVCVTCPFLVLRLLARLFMILVNGLTAGARSIMAKRPASGPTSQPPIRREGAGAVVSDNTTGAAALSK